MFELRARLYALVRTFFAQRGVLEVETPVLSAAGNTEPNIEGFVTAFRGHVDAGAPTRYLRTSPEYPLKRLLAEGLGDCYELGRVFRNGEAGRRHNPEFTLLEWYRVGMDVVQLAAETAALVQATRALGPSGAGEGEGGTLVTTYRELFLAAVDLDPFRATDEALRGPLARFDVEPRGLERDDWLDLLFTHCIQPHFPRGRITVIHEWPATQCALARIRRGDPPVAERFELYLGVHELANGYHELNDAAEQRARFEHENRHRRRRGQDVLPLDEKLLATLDALPDCAGVALGIERLVMCLLGSDDIADAMAFTFADA